MPNRPTKPTFQAVIDLGLRDVGVRNQPRRFARQFGRSSAQVFVFAVLFAVVMCGLATQTPVGAWIVFPLVLMSTVGILWFALRQAKQTPVMVMKVAAEGTNQVTWLLLAQFGLLVPFVLLTWNPLVVPLLALAAIAGVILWRTRGNVPAALARLRPLLAQDEPVLGDGIGRVAGAWRWDEAFRVVVATDRRLLVAGSARAEPFVRVDVPYERVRRFGIEWKFAGRLGELSLTVAPEEGAPAETHVVTQIGPANAVSIARTLRSHGVETDDPAAVAEAERGWEEARERSVAQRPEPRRRVLDRAAMDTPQFDRGMWLFLALAAFAFYVNPFGVGVGARRSGDLLLLAVPLICGICGYVSATRSSLAFLVPLNLLAAPAFFFWDANYVIALMVLLSAAGALGAWAGSALREGAGAPAEPAAPAAPRPGRDSLRGVLSGLGLVRITGMLLAGLLTLVVTASAAGFELTSLRLAVDELTMKRLQVDGRSDLPGEAAGFSYTPGPGLRELITDTQTADDPGGARWELRSKFTKGFNAISLAQYRYDDPLDDAAAVAEFVERKDREHEWLAGYRVTHTERVIAGRKAYVWNHGSERGYWYYAAWFPGPAGAVRVECIARKQEDRFRRLCAEAMRSLKFRR